MRFVFLKKLDILLTWLKKNKKENRPVVSRLRGAIYDLRAVPFQKWIELDSGQQIVK